ncbi:MAG: hypothetical protein ACT4O4_06890 [Nitrospiraceae bacterium]
MCIDLLWKGTRQEVERISAVREYIHEQIPNAAIRDSYDPGRLAQVFRIEASELGGSATR